MTSVHHIGFDVHVYPGEINPIVKMMNHIDPDDYSPSELSTLMDFIDAFKDQALNS